MVERPALIGRSREKWHCSEGRALYCRSVEQ